MVRPAPATPSLRLAATEPTPAIAMTPSAMQAMNTPKPRKPPRNSRQAKRNAKRSAKPCVICCSGLIAGASIGQSPWRFGHHTGEKEMGRHIDGKRQADKQTHEPHPARHEIL